MKKSIVQMIGIIVAMAVVAIALVYGKDIVAALMSSLNSQSESMLDQILR